jgi:uncharacterized protein (DUF305 family)
MDTKSLAYGIVGFLFGGLVVSGAAVLADEDEQGGSPTMSQVSAELRNKEGDAFDEAFINGMIEHHEGAIEMAEMASDRAKHQEIKQLSEDIIEAQEAEIAEMEQWREQWGYGAASESGHSGGH